MVRELLRPEAKDRFRQFFEVLWRDLRCDCGWDRGLGRGLARRLGAPGVKNYYWLARRGESQKGR